MSANRTSFSFFTHIPPAASPDDKKEPTVNHQEVKKGDFNRLTWLASREPPDRTAIRRLGDSYFNGHGVTPDDKKAAALYKEAAHLGSRKAKRQLGKMFELGRGVPKDIAEASYWYFESASTPFDKSLRFSSHAAFFALARLAETPPTNTYVSVLFYTGRLYHDGCDPLGELNKAESYFIQAAALGHATSMHYLGHMYESRFMRKNPSIAEYWYRRSVTRDNSVRNPSLERLKQLTALTSSEETKSLPTDSQFDAQVIIDCMQDPDCSFHPTTLNLLRKWQRSRPEPCFVLRWEDLYHRTWQFHKLNEKKPRLLRIYISGHHRAPHDYIVGIGGSVRIPVELLAEDLAFFLEKQNAIINVTSCQAGRGNRLDNADSFGAQLQKQLSAATGRTVPVVARTSNMLSTPKGKLTYSLPALNIKPKERKLYFSKQQHSKVTFTNDEKGTPICVDSYKLQAIKKADAEQWKKTALIAIDKAMRDTSHKLKKDFLNNWLKEFTEMPASIMHEKMQQEWDKPESILRAHSRSFSQWRNKPTKTADALLPLLLRAQKIFNHHVELATLPRLI